MNISAIFIRRPIATSLIMAAIALFGVLAYRGLAVSDLPAVDYPTVNVQAGLPGADPNIVVHRDDMRVIDRGRRVGLVEEPLLGALVLDQPRRQQLPRAHALEALVLGTEHHRHPALADAFLQLVPGHARARAQ